MRSECRMLSALFMIRDDEFFNTITDPKDKQAYVDEWEIIAPQKLNILKQRIRDKYKEVCIYCVMIAVCAMALCASVCPSVTSQCSIKTAKHVTITQTTPSNR